MAAKFKFFDHTADAKFQAFGKTLNETFANAAIATYEIITETKKIKPKLKKELTIHAAQKRSLLYDFLEELIFLTDTQGFLLKKATNVKIKEIKKDNKREFKLTATLIGDKAKGYELKTQVKAVTYSDMFIKEAKDKVVVQVVLDI